MFFKITRFPLKKIKVHQDDLSESEKNMRYFIYYPPRRAIRLIDVGENVLVEDVLTLIKKEFNLDTKYNGTAETSIVLNYNGSDLKPKWSLVDLSIPSGSIIRCLYREEQAADLYVYCSYNKQIFKLYDSSITIETTIGDVRKKISNKLGLPLSLFCLENYHNKKRLYDEMKLINYDIKIHDHLYLKVWQGYEKFIDACVKGFTEQYAYDDLTRHYQAQIALYIAAFYGHMELANSAMQQGARTDHPVGEHPSRQWSSETSAQVLPESLKCPIHIAIERAHVKIVDLFVRQSIICTQVRDPISNYLPYKLALSCSLSTQNKDEQQLYRVIYYYLHDKQYNLRIPLNANGDYVSDLLTSTVSASAFHRRSTNYAYVSLPFYCRIIRWYERAREKIWKKHCTRLYNGSQTRRIYPKQGLLGYKVLIDGFNNAFELPIEQLRNLHSGDTEKAEQSEYQFGYDEEEKEKINKMKLFIKHFALDDRKRAKQKAAENLQHSRRPPVFQQTKLNQTKSTKTSAKTNESSLTLSNHQKGTPTNKNLNITKIMTEKEIPMAPNVTPIAFMKHFENHQIINNKHKNFSKLSNDTSPMLTSRTSSIEDEETYALHVINSSPSDTNRLQSSLTNQLATVSVVNKNGSQPLMSSVDAYALSSACIAREREQRKATKRQELFSQIEQTQNQTKNLKGSATSSTSNFRKLVNTDNYIPLPDHPTLQRSNLLKSRRDLELRQTTVETYERYASASTRSTAIQCLQEAGCFKGKSWLRQVEISKEMMKNDVKRRFRRANDETTNKVCLLPLRTDVVATSATTNRSTRVTVN